MKTHKDSPQQKNSGNFNKTTQQNIEADLSKAFKDKVDAFMEEHKAVLDGLAK